MIDGLQYQWACDTARGATAVSLSMPHETYRAYYSSAILAIENRVSIHAGTRLSLVCNDMRVYFAM